MNIKTVLIIVISVLVTIILMNNTDEMSFWIFGEARIPKLAILGCMFGLGLISGYLLGRPGKRPEGFMDSESASSGNPGFEQKETDQLSEEDREYIR